MGTRAPSAMILFGCLQISNSQRLSYKFKVTKISLILNPVTLALPTERTLGLVLYTCCEVLVICAAPVWLSAFFFKVISKDP